MTKWLSEPQFSRIRSKIQQNHQKKWAREDRLISPFTLSETHRILLHQSREKTMKVAIMDHIFSFFYPPPEKIQEREKAEERRKEEEKQREVDELERKLLDEKAAEIEMRIRANAAEEWSSDEEEDTEEDMENKDKSFVPSRRCIIPEAKPIKETLLPTAGTPIKSEEKTNKPLIEVPTMTLTPPEPKTGKKRLAPSSEDTPEPKRRAGRPKKNTALETINSKSKSKSQPSTPHLPSPTPSHETPPPPAPASPSTPLPLPPMTCQTTNILPSDIIIYLSPKNYTPGYYKLSCPFCPIQTFSRPGKSADESCFIHMKSRHRYEFSDVGKEWLMYCGTLIVDGNEEWLVEMRERETAKEEKREDGGDVVVWSKGKKIVK